MDVVQEQVLAGDSVVRLILHDGREVDQRYAPVSSHFAHDRSHRAQRPQRANVLISSMLEGDLRLLVSPQLAERAAMLVVQFRVATVDGHRRFDVRQRVASTAGRQCLRGTFEIRLPAPKFRVTEALTVLTLKGRAVSQIGGGRDQYHLGSDRTGDVDHARQVETIVVQHLLLQLVVPMVGVRSHRVVQQRCHLRFERT